MFNYTIILSYLYYFLNAAQEMKICIKNLSSIFIHLPKSLMENLIFCAAKCKGRII